VSTTLTAAPGWRDRRLLLRVLVLITGLVALKSFFLDPLSGHFGGTFEDFSAYMGAARSMAAGGSPYAQFDPGTVVNAGFVYPPFTAILVRPLALLNDRAATIIWLALTLACSAAAAVIVARTALPASWPRTELGLLAAAAFAPAAYNYWHGQINPLIFLLLALAYRSYVRDREITVGVLLGLAAGIKVAPLVLIVLLLRRRWWRGSAAMVATGALTVVIGLAVLGIGTTRAFLADVFPALMRATGWIYDQSLGGAISRLGDQSVLVVQQTSLFIQAANIAAALFLLAAVAWATRPGVRAPAERSAEFGLGVSAMLLAGSIAWFPHFLHLLIPIFAAFGLALARGWRTERNLVMAAAATLFAFGVLAPAAIGQLDIFWIGRLSHTAAWWPFLQLASIPCFCAVWLVVALTRSLRADVPSRTRSAVGLVASRAWRR
jgi:alpha-1,2-mannosyltransferase